MLRQTQQEKTERTFRLLDTDSDGRINRSDFEAMASRVIGAYGEPSSPKARAVRDAYVNEWEQGFAHRAGGGEDGALTLNDFKEVADEFMNANGGDGYHQTVRPVIQAIVDLADTEGDGVLS
jgi:EF hand